MKFLSLLLCFLALASCRNPSHSDHEHSEEKTHPAEAVLESSEERGFRLSAPAIQTLGIETIVLKQSGIAEVPPSALVYFQDEVGVYRLRDGWFRLIHLDDPQDLRAGDAVAIRGAAFLRVTDMSLFGEELSGHHH
jgi:hypothetical protein